ncbi:anaerobic ribonucleoside triphosphate reductase [Paenibacillus alvei]|uniref:Anaerobic ribonucleoside triphosphate reductase n=3 Tax=Paenibacillus TaxID=44249 RepID=A0ABT4H364_PAEAL|nr:anaerobic ribonucleoside triphosphate reductase [Paenibacillus alvei]EJW17113.1 anaerobic ribonucleoside-triphosphate reductase NrdD [Paenibacillus alvei DSM 29]MCY7483916.1 anaerobic ribonucleoside triphosphate reductase [Paenibacillus alvei]MCY9541532.1 anaerobic ribonucleoside triphosphate reductase [Paenibacillus alvei]MCY9734978.1 anaerobic ribonucleoside triphosphate reductase [Paenibacillus alvei]MCY9763410.1 anaerobic ribonucleoside triphosphate reductase [Paenibacillus alvei]
MTMVSMKRTSTVWERSKPTGTERLTASLHDIVDGGNQDLMQENANVDGRSPMGMMGKIASESARWYTIQHLLSADVREAVEQNLMYPHDLDFYASGTTTCCQIPLGKLLKQGFNTGHGYMREPQDIKSALALASIILQANQNQQHGGQAYPMFDYDVAPYVRKTYNRHLRYMESLPLPEDFDLAAEVWRLTERDVYQACEAFIHNANSMHSRGGGQVPFISLNYGTDTSLEGRMLVKQLLLATQAGLGRGETPIFPIQIFKVKKGVNFDSSDPNYDLYQLALQTTAQRLFPNFAFLDAPFNAQYDNGTPESEACYMGCRTRVMGNVNGEETAIGRGNLSFTSLNLVRLAMLSSSIDDFFIRLDTILKLTVKQLTERLEYQSKKQVRDFAFLMKQGVWRGSENLQPEDELGEILKQGTLSVGFIGLAEALVALTGTHHGESEEARKLGMRIVTHMRMRMDEAITATGLNFSLIATPAEGLSGKFTSRDRADFGVRKGITDRKYYTNSFHVPVYCSVKAIDKIRIEGPFHELCNAGHITYVELDGSAKANPKALDRIVRAMAASGIGYGSLNHPVDRCRTCGHQDTIEDSCPVCGSSGNQIERIRRITGYLVGDMNKWNTAKRTEESERVKHQ